MTSANFTRSVFFVLLCFFAGALSPVFANEPGMTEQGSLPDQPPRVLLLNSYDPLFPSSESVVQQVRETFKEESIRLSVEFMDSKALWNGAFVDNYSAYLQEKYSQLPPFNLIISVDDNALQMLLDKRVPALTGVPVVFLGVNDVERMEKALVRLPSTGIYEATSIPDTVDMMRALVPQMRRLVVIRDGTPSGTAVWSTVQQVLKETPLPVEIQFHILDLSELSWGELAAELRVLSSADSILLTSAYADKSGIRKSFDEAIELIGKNSRQPVFHLWRHGIGSGLMGGVVVDMGEQARIAAEMALDILDGIAPRNLPPVSRSPNIALVDASLLNSSGLSSANLSPQTRFINEPEDLFVQYGKVLLLALAIISALLVVLAVVLWVLLLRKAVAQKSSELAKSQQTLQEQEAKYRAIFDHVPDSIFVIDMETERFVEFNDQAHLSLGYTREEFSNLLAPEVKFDESPEQVKQRMQLVQQQGRLVFTTTHKTKAGAPVYVRIHASLIELGGKNRLVGVISDITAEIEEADFLGTLIGTAPVGIGILKKGIINTVNPCLCEKLGMSESELLGLSMAVLYPDTESYQRDQKLIEKSQERKEHSELETRLKTRNGTIIDVLLRYACISPGKPEEGLVFTVLDITERKEFERRLIMLSEVVSQSSDALMTLDADLHVTYVNQAFQTVYGYSSSELIGKNPELLNRDHDCMLQQPEVLERLALGESITVETVNCRRDGSEFIAEIRITGIRGNKGEILAYMASHKDVTATRQAQRELEASEARYRTLLEQIPQGVVVVDKDGKVTSANSATSEILGRDVLGTLVPGFVQTAGKPTLFEDGREMSAAECPLGEIAQTGKMLANRVLGTWNPKKEDYVWLNLDAMPFALQSTEDSDQTLIIFSDVTEARTLQRALVQTQRMEAVGQLTGGIAHDFNNILASVLGFAQLAKKRFGGTDTKLDEYLGQIETSGQRARDLVRQLLIFSRGGSTRGAESLMLSAEISEIVAMLRPMIPSSIEIVTRLDAPSPLALIDPLHLQQLIVNLCINARDAMDGKGVLTISLSTQTYGHERCVLTSQEITGEWVQISVADTGSGIDPKVRGNLFQPFISTKEVGKGTGMGLAVVHGIMMTYRGRMLLESSAEDGTCFRILLPKIHRHSKGQVLLPESGVHSDLPPGRKILVVDDEDSIREYLKELLQTHAAEVECCANAAEARKLVLADPDQFDAIVTDQTMPGMSGLQLIESIRKLNASVPIVLCSGHSLELQRDAVELLNISEVLLKPVDANHLISVLAEVLPEVIETA